MQKGNLRRGKRGETYNRALHVLARMRRTGLTLTAAAREEHIDPRTVRKYLGPELRRRARPSKTDRRRRDMLIPTALGTSPVTVRGSKQASLLGRYMSAVGKYLRTGEVGALAEFQGQSIGGHALITDPDTLSVVAQAGALTLDEIYAPPESSS
jgi:lambda repressor-like predicted transcriptional regulator